MPARHFWKWHQAIQKGIPILFVGGHRPAPRKPGPKGPRKLTPALVKRAKQLKDEQPWWGTKTLLQKLKDEGHAIGRETLRKALRSPSS